MPATTAQFDAAAGQVLLALAGSAARVREDQYTAAHALAVEGRRALVVQATGWGKSAVYWMAAKALRDAGDGPTLIISPLLALMRDQVAAARRAGLRAVTLNSTNMDDWEAIESSILAGDVDVILLSPERLANPRFAQTTLASISPRLGLVVIDEAHALSAWGHDFRPDYRRVASLLLARPGLPVLATTATANARVSADVAEILGPGTLVLRGPLARTSLHLSVLPRMGLADAFAWVDTALPSLPGSGIVYASTVANVVCLTELLRSRGHVVAAYHGQLDAVERERVEDLLRADQVKAVIATSALGMGYDKPDLGFVVHVGSPASPIDYYQQVGRAGRALDEAQVVLIPTPADDALWEYFATSSIPDPQEAAAVLDALTAISPQSMTVPALEAATGVRRSRVELLVKTLAVEGAVERTVDGWASTGIPWTYDHARYAQLVAARRAEAAIMREYTDGGRCLELLLRHALDDEVASDPCGRCSHCLPFFPPAVPSTAGAEQVQAAQIFLSSRDVVLAPRRLFAPNLRFAGRIGADLECEPGRALAFADDPAWPQVQALLRQPDAPAPQWLLDALVRVLARWSWSSRPDTVVPVPSSTHPLLIASIAQHLATVGRLERVDALALSGGAAATGLSTSARACHQDARLSVVEGISLPSRTVLLVDDVWRTGWTATLAGALLRQAGAAMVLPLVVHSAP